LFANGLARMKGSKPFRFIDLFAGLGGFHVGLSSIGGRCVFACEIDDQLCQLYALNHHIEPAGDIRDIGEHDIPSHDVLCAGFPCQPFSKAGEQRGTACEVAGDLFEKHLLRIIAAHRPRFLMLENVPNLERHHGGTTYRWMRSQLESLGYAIDQRLLSPHRFGIPQVRDRLFIVGARGGLTHFRWPNPVAKPLAIETVLDTSPPDARPLPPYYVECLEVWQEFLDRFPKHEELPSFPIWSMEFGADYPFEHVTPDNWNTRRLARFKGSHGNALDGAGTAERLSLLPSHARAGSFPLWKQRFIRQNRDLYDRHRTWIKPWLRKLAPFPSSLQKFEWNCKGFERSVWKTIVQFRASGVRVKRPTTAPALVAMTTTQVPIIAAQRRYMTVRECARLQSLGGLANLPEASTRSYKALGNAVNATLVRLVAESMLAIDAPARPRARWAPPVWVPAILG
jgi:DNA (cytosine-5)-methyltransferase 1